MSVRGRGIERSTSLDGSIEVLNGPKLSSTHVMELARVPKSGMFLSSRRLRSDA